jgi:hypothetical protein
MVMDPCWSMNATDTGQSAASRDDNTPTVAREFGRWGFRRVQSGQLPNHRARGDARAHLTVTSTVNAPNVLVDTDDWGVFVWIWRYGSRPWRYGSASARERQ